jgi:hypothetical protein
MIDRNGEKWRFSRLLLSPTLWEGTLDTSRLGNRVNIVTLEDRHPSLKSSSERFLLTLLDFL